MPGQRGGGPFARAYHMFLSIQTKNDFNPCLKSAGLKPRNASESPGELVRIHITEPHSRKFRFNGNGVGPENVHHCKMLILRILK